MKQLLSMFTSKRRYVKLPENIKLISTCDPEFSLSMKEWMTDLSVGKLYSKFTPICIDGEDLVSAIKMQVALDAQNIYYGKN